MLQHYSTHHHSSSNACYSTSTSYQQPFEKDTFISTHIFLHAHTHRRTSRSFSDMVFDNMSTAMEYIHKHIRKKQAHFCTYFHTCIHTLTYLPFLQWCAQQQGVEVVWRSWGGAPPSHPPTPLNETQRKRRRRILLPRCVPFRAAATRKYIHMYMCIYIHVNTQCRVACNFVLLQHVNINMYACVYV